MVNYIALYNRTSKGGQGVLKSLGLTPIGLDDVGHLCSPASDRVINWGISRPNRSTGTVPVANLPNKVKFAVNKKVFFDKFKSVARIPPFTTDVEEALKWVEAGDTVMARCLTNSKGGKGIVFHDDEKDFEEFLSAPLYTKYIKKKYEFRLHFSKFGGIHHFDQQQKKVRKLDLKGNPVDIKNVDYRVQSYRNGFVFCRNEVEIPPDVILQGTKIFEASELDFVAMDIIYNHHKGEAYVLEMNTAPGIEGTTLLNYTKELKKFLEA